MTKPLFKVKTHFRNGTNAAKTHIKSNSGDGYILFLMLVLFSILLFGAIFNILKIRVMATNIYDQVENVADIVISDIKQDSYQKLIKGSTNNSKLAYDSDTTTASLIKDMSCLLLYDPDIDVLTLDEFIKNNNDGVMQYRLYDVDIEYIDSGNENAGAVIKVTFSVDVPVYLNGTLFDTDTETFTKFTTFNFKT